MDIIGVQVKHASFGTGKVIAQENNTITVEFAAKTTRFVFPDCFNKFITAYDADLQVEILADIAARKKARVTAIAQQAKAAAPISKIDTMFDDDYHVAFWRGIRS